MPAVPDMPSVAPLIANLFDIDVQGSIVAAYSVPHASWGTWPARS